MTTPTEALKLARDALALTDAKMPLDRSWDDNLRAMHARKRAIAAIDALAQPQPSAPSVEPAAVVYPPDGTVSPFTVINLGSGKVQMGDSIHDGRLPALWFGKNGQGMGHEEAMNRMAHEGETLAVVTFANVEGLDVLADVIQRIRRVSFPDAGTAPTAQAPQPDDVLARVLRCRYPVEKSIHPSGFGWDTPRLNEVVDDLLGAAPLMANGLTEAETGATASVAGISKLDPNEDDPGRLWAEIARLCAALKGPDGYATWQDAATAERVLLVKAERAAQQAAPVSAPEGAMPHHAEAVDHAHELLRRMGYHRDGDHIINVNRQDAEAMHVSTIATIVHAALIVSSQAAPAGAAPEPVAFISPSALEWLNSQPSALEWLNSQGFCESAFIHTKLAKVANEHQTLAIYTQAVAAPITQPAPIGVEAVAEAQRLADALTEIEAVLTRNGYMSPPILEAVALLRTLAAQAAQERPAVDVEALMALADKYAEMNHGHDTTTYRAALRAALEGLK